MDLIDVLIVQDASAWGKLDFAKYLLRHRPDRATRRFIGSLLSLNVFELISETFESDAMRGLWAVSYTHLRRKTATTAGRTHAPRRDAMTQTTDSGRDDQGAPGKSHSNR